MNALPLILKTVFMPGIKNKVPTDGSKIIFSRVSSLLLPDRSGIIIVLSSCILTNPTLSPRGETSACPFLPLEDITTKGDKFMKFLECFSKLFITFKAALPFE